MGVTFQLKLLQVAGLSGRAKAPLAATGRQPQTLIRSDSRSWTYPPAGQPIPPAPT